ncbi:MAG: FUN14 domain-containing protein, partial [Leucothrix sp.]
TFMKIFFFGAGTLFIALFVLQYNGIIGVNWGSFEVAYNTMIDWVSPHLGGLKNFMTANLSSATLAGVGLFWGLRRK